ncbi:TPA: helix-turn-helix transcriptional regulator [Haemophilus influenzae]|uniref:helix-turn-helix domain-containing protein n=1 Tax=Haemophilus influenzae TaxID=727 RepID=UPI000DD3E216|nr:helix-turn-helix transcriptional regulator [Haemophilus influenzae]MCK8913650.1 helix-turn-helix domain-containing protein [Haemophilus influenzae]MCK8925065.1 helix-turn-helix domain-containing protein [Haemophilus influenzae]MCK9086897.1 helix-turn-helix domain-containing protein [Haemophilus influenzae]MCK9089018.1 helix-turn-helix domain-containing protein [Haemophilus influenzae]MCK9106510.1 helix-turn-helix domain-containing protein [Haemophilus influenzae]
MGMHDKIRMMRELRQLSQEDMAEKMNMSPSGYAKIERGETRLQYDKLVQIAQIFNVSLSDLVDNDKGVIFFMNKNGNNTSANYYSGDHSIMFEIEKLKLQLIHKNELLEQKEKELETLRKMISLLEK